jgi:hypothetical protein
MKEGNREEAKKIVESVVKKYESLAYAELKAWVKEKRIETKEVAGDSGVEYQVELEAMWDDKPNGAIRFSGSIYDDSSSRILKIKTPISYDFLKHE